MRGEFFKDMKGRHEERRDSRSRRQLTIEEEKDTIERHLWTCSCRMFYSSIEDRNHSVCFFFEFYKNVPELLFSLKLFEMFVYK